ncbi:MAG: hypothetical protein DI533_01940 [Cereibacter sphaeroides]|uniref:DUF177 domain-containing protein n=1 Tax=Cereibacter sphaeroides TaxID=1063 RepID=A0A2W5S8Y2_CERSP|nr:MAG: hypothetical protein DI533_01940 [Cereibacter sphaeroides]
MPESLPVSLPLRVQTLGARKPTRFDLKPDEAERAALAEYLGISAIPSLRFKGELRPQGKSDYLLEARLEAEVVQPCVVTLVPVLTRVDEPVVRKYLADFAVPEDAEAEMPEDDSAEPLPTVIDPGAVMTEALALALPDYPRAPGAELGEAIHAPPGVVPLRDADLRPFAGLGGLLRTSDDDDGKRDA